MKKLIIYSMLLCSIKANAQVPTQGLYPNAPITAFDLNKYSFFIDSIKASNEQTANFIASSNNITVSQTINLLGTTAGVHQLYAKVTNTNGNPSIFNLGNFYMEGGNSAYPNAALPLVDINKYSFFIDSIKTTNEQVENFVLTNSNTNATQAINIAGTTTGVHQLYAKVTNTNGNPSIFNLGNFYMEGGNSAYPNGPLPAIDINKYSFYIDSIKTINEQNVTFAASNNNTNAAQNITLTGTASGVHQLYAKVTNTNGNPSIFNLGNFYMEGDNKYQNTANTATNINRYEFFIDSVKNNAIPLSFAATVSNTTTNSAIDLNNVLPGSHQIFAKVYDVNNIQSVVNLGNFLMEQNYRYANTPTVVPNLQTLEYYIDNDPGYGLATPFSIASNSNDINLVNQTITISNLLPVGNHNIFIRSKQNPWSIVNAFQFEVQSAPLPLTWLQIKAQLIFNTVQINWITTNEINTSKFEIEWSSDGIVFTKIGSIIAAGNSSNTSNYLFTHPNPTIGFNYYRLKQIDLTGSFTYSEVVKILNKQNLKHTLIAPNPVKDVLTIIEPKNEDIKAAYIYDSQGKLVYQKNINANLQVLNMTVNSLYSGKYILKIQYTNYSKSFTIIKE